MRASVAAGLLTRPAALGELGLGKQDRSGAVLAPADPKNLEPSMSPGADAASKGQPAVLASQHKNARARGVTHPPVHAYVICTVALSIAREHAMPV